MFFAKNKCKQLYNQMILNKYNHKHQLIYNQLLQQFNHQQFHKKRNLN